MKYKGSVTILCSLSLSSFLLIASVFARLCIINAEKERFEIASDVSLNAVFGEYEKNLYEEFGLLYIDTSYLGQTADIENLRRHLDHYMKKNTDAVFRKQHAPWGRLRTEEVQIAGYRTAAYREGGSMRSQAIHYVETYPELWGLYGEVTEALPFAEGIAFREEADPVGEWSSLMEAIEGKEKPKIEEEDGSLREVSVNNPADWVYGLCGSDLLYNAGINPGGMSGALVNTGALLSKRGSADQGRLSRGMDSGVLSEETDTYVIYVLDKFGCYQQEKDRLLKLELEYLVAGRDSDYENFKAVAERIFLIRFADNLSLAMGDGGLWSDAMGAAEALEICAYDMTFAEPVANSILFACAFLETMSDLKTLYDGGRVPLSKGSHSMRVSDVLNGVRYTRGGSDGLSYRQYLICFLGVLPSGLFNYRSMDLIELEIRRRSANPNFRMDGCTERVYAELIGSGNGLSGYRLNRTYGYY